VAEEAEFGWMPDLSDQDCGEPEYLHDRVEFAEQAGAEVFERAGGEEQGRDEQDSEVAAEDEHGDIARHEIHVGEDEEEGAEEELVGDGIEVLTEAGALGEHAREQAVEAVAKASENEEAESEAVAAIEDRDNEERDDEQTRQREQVWSVAELSEEIHVGRASQS